MAEESLPEVAPEAARRRRQVLQALAGGVSAGFALPAALQAGETHQHVRRQLRLEQAADAAGGSLPRLLDSHQKETLVTLAEAVVPGSTKADVAGFLDRLLAVDAPEKQREFLGALGAIDGEAFTRFGRAWKALDAAQRVSLLTAVATGAPSLRERFDLLKTRIAVAYYTSEVGLRELGYTGGMIHQGLVGCTHPDGHR